MKLEALIFDVDGTLAETEELHRQSFNLAFQQHKLDWDWDPDLYARLLQTTGGRERMVAYVETYVSEKKAALEKLPAVHKSKTRGYVDMLSKGALRLRPGVERLIDEARERGLKLAIATTTTPQNVEALLTSTLGPEGPSWFFIAAGDVEGPKKPHPAVYLAALAGLDVDPAHVVAFEDSMNGLRAARAAGITVVVAPSLYLVDEDFAGAASIVSNLGEPDKPFEQLAGWPFPRAHVDIDGLDALLTSAG